MRSMFDRNVSKFRLMTGKVRSLCFQSLVALFEIITAACSLEAMRKDTSSLSGWQKAVPQGRPFICINSIHRNQIVGQRASKCHCLGNVWPSAVLVTEMLSRPHLRGPVHHLNTPWSWSGLGFRQNGTSKTRPAGNSILILFSLCLNTFFILTWSRF